MVGEGALNSSMLVRFQPRDPSNGDQSVMVSTRGCDPLRPGSIPGGLPKVIHPSSNGRRRGSDPLNIGSSPVG